MNDLLNIKEAANLIGVSIDTLRRWDEAGKLPAIRAGGKGSHRFYQKSDLELFLKDPFYLAKSWAFSQAPFEPEKDFYCPNSSVFQGRLTKLEFLLQKVPEFKNSFSLITSITGEIGNNSFDHNLGSWPDINGTFFAFDVSKRIIVLADRGHGILTTLRRVRPELKDDRDALEMAFTKIITGRAPEKRGNGLKFVRKAISQSSISLLFQSGDAQLKLEPNSNKIHPRKVENNFHGCLAFIKF
ncbi:helix-turn-helix domain-containing protein [Candidatus Peregrinibacteria bacterium]|nr:helix-turn-helix domain-containing protein [Candidatus Peregrinibacteria bacterium]